MSEEALKFLPRQEGAEAVVMRVYGAADFAQKGAIETGRDCCEVSAGQFVALYFRELALPLRRLASAFGAMRFRRIHRHNYSLVAQRAAYAAKHIEIEVGAVAQ